MDLLFVYGTLRGESDNPYARLLRARAEKIGPAVAPGSIFRIAHYPGYRPEPAGTVHGELYRLADPEATFRILDEYEGPEFERVRGCFQLAGAAGVESGWIYRFVTQPPESARIVSGDFFSGDFGRP